MNLQDNNLNYLNRGSKVIPGLSQLLSKRPDQFCPGQWPTYFSRAKGTRIWDANDVCYLDMSISGIGANVLGYCDNEVDEAVFHAVKTGNSSSLLSTEEVELAEKLLGIHSWAQCARFGKGGGECMTIAVRIARAATSKEIILFCGYHGWHDWYIAANLSNNKQLTNHLLPNIPTTGLPRSLEGSAYSFNYNDLTSLEELLKRYGPNVAAIALEPIRNHYPKGNFLKKVKELAYKYGALLIFDEVSSGFRLCNGGAHLKLGVEPDIAVFAKAISNGYPFGAIIGKEEVMRSAEDTFISSTYWTEKIGFCAALATIIKFEEKKVHKRLNEVGERIQKGWADISDRYNIEIDIGGIPPLSHFSFRGEDSMIRLTYIIQEMLKRRILTSNRCYINYAMTDDDISLYLNQLEEVFYDLALSGDDVKSKLNGPIASPGFTRFSK